ncbi:RHS repeat domain-containing protein, partial [Raoultella sp. 18093]|uniref:RHS repeat domain-containing protein n=1 Tax=Raoultella sp. 18093 TaxID=2681425 RepID=UPI00135C01F0
MDALGAVTQTTYGANTVSTKAYANAIGVAGWQAADFTPARVLGTVQGSGQDRVTVQTLDGAGRVVRTVDAAGYVVGREYDGTGQLQHVVEYALQAGTPSAQDRHTRYTYDGAGRLVGKTDALGGQQYHTYDALGNRIAFTDEVGAA